MTQVMFLITCILSSFNPLFGMAAAVADSRQSESEVLITRPQRQSTILTFDQLVRSSMILARSPITVEDCHILDVYTRLSEKQEVKQSTTDIRTLLKTTLKSDGEQQALYLGTAGKSNKNENNDLPFLNEGPPEVNPDVSQLCEYIREEKVEELKKAAKALWPERTNENMRKVRCDFKDEKDLPLLFYAIAKDSGYMVKILIEEFQIPVNQLWQNKEGVLKTALEYALAKKKSFTKYLEQQGAKKLLQIQTAVHPDQLPPKASARIMKYIKGEKAEKLKAFVTKLWPNNTNEMVRKIHDKYGNSLLFLAAYKDSQKMVEMLVRDLKVPVNEVCNGCTVVDLLIELTDAKYADLIKIDLVNNHAAKNGIELMHFEGHEKFTKRPPTRQKPVEWKESQLKKLCHQNTTTIQIAQLEEQDLDTGEFLKKAVIAGIAELVKRLVEKLNAPLNSLDENGLTAYDYAVKNGHRRLSEYLAHRGGFTGRRQSETRVMENYKNSPSEIKELIELTCSLRTSEEIKCSKGSLALVFLSAALGKIFLLRNNSKLALNMFNKYDQTPFDVAIQSGQFLAAYVIQRSGGKRSDIFDKAESKSGESAYMNNLEAYEAVLQGDQKKLSQLVSPMTDVDNLLALACHTNQPRIMKYLVATCNANIHFKIGGITPILDMAYANPEIIEFLKKK